MNDAKVVNREDDPPILVTCDACGYDYSVPVLQYLEERYYGEEHFCPSCLWPTKGENK